MQSAAHMTTTTHLICFNYHAHAVICAYNFYSFTYRISAQKHYYYKAYFKFIYYILNQTIQTTVWLELSSTIKCQAHEQSEYIACNNIEGIPDYLNEPLCSPPTDPNDNEPDRTEYKWSYGRRDYDNECWADLLLYMVISVDRYAL